MCHAYSGSEDLSSAQSFTGLINAVLAQRNSCLSLVESSNFDSPENAEAIQCCRDHSPGSGDDWILKGICAMPWLTNLNIWGLENRNMSPQEKMSLYTSILGDFIGVSSAGKYYEANPEFWCQNCPDDYRKNCPFDPVTASEAESNQTTTNEALCDCPGGRIADDSTPFWAMESDHRLGSDFITCSDKAKVYRSWIVALFPEWTDEQYDHAEGRFNSKCWQGKGWMGYILTVGPVLAVFAGFFCGLAHIPYLMNSPVRDVGFNFAMLAVALTLVAFWPLSFTGAVSIASRYDFCYGLEYPVVEDGSGLGGAWRHAPVFFNGNPCYDVNSNGEYKYNPFVKELGVFNSGYVLGGALVIIALICLLGVISKDSDVLMETTLAAKRDEDNGRR